MPSDKKIKKPTAAQIEFEKKFTAYMEERMLNQAAQIRAVAIAAGITAEKFFEAFVDDKAQDEFYIHLHAAEDIHNASVQESQGAQDSLQQAETEGPDQVTEGAT